MDVAKTYPDMDIDPKELTSSNLKRLKNYKTKAEMDDFKRKKIMHDLEKQKNDWDSAHPPDAPLTSKKSEFLIENPKYKTVSEMIETKKRKAR